MFKRAWAYLFGPIAAEAPAPAIQIEPPIEKGRFLSEQIMAAYNLRGLAGYTADEVAERIGKGVLSVRPTVTRLFQSGKLRRTGVKRRNRSGLDAHVFVSTRIPTARSGIPITAA